MSQELSTTSYALLGLLTFGDDLTGYELKQRADNTLRFYWVSPAMSKVYTELARLADAGLVTAREAGPNKQSTKYRITARGRQSLTRWLERPQVGFPLLKHPVALRLLVGHMVDPETTTRMMRTHLDALAARRADLAAVRESLAGADGPGEAFRYPSLVADWGLEYFDGETEILTKLLARLESET
ncbi:MAG TPA: PadR family transcriptional regulator [Nocardioidaceae bacterium]|nr:PadR family transcriptional regulator [Nocardioidaceae bacterium]